MDEILHIVNGTKTFGDLRVLQNVNLSIKAGDRLAVIGPSGAGKSTLLHVAGLMDELSGGELIFGGKKASELADSEKSRFRLEQIGFLFQFHYLLPDFTLFENIMMPLRLSNSDLTKGEERGAALLESLGIAQRKNHWPHQLSGGEQQRAALARALILDPKILFCDEPTGNLDSPNAKSMMDLLWGITKSRDMAIVLVTHNVDLARQVDTSYHLSDGNLTRIEL